MFSKFVSIENFVKKHRVAIAVTGTSIAFLTLMYSNNRELNKFLKEHDLYDEYYYEEAEEI